MEDAAVVAFDFRGGEENRSLISFFDRKAASTSDALQSVRLARAMVLFFAFSLQYEPPKLIGPP